MIAQAIALPGLFTQATLPAPNEAPNTVAWVTDAPTQGGGTTTGLMICDGVAWKSGVGKRMETFTGTTNASGIATFTWAAYGAAPNPQPVIINGSTEMTFTVPSANLTTTGCQVSVRERASLTVLGINLLSFATTAVSGATVRLLVIES